MAVDSPICPKCGAQNEPEARFCGNCGAPLGQAALQDRPAEAPIGAAPATPVRSEQPATRARPRWLLPAGGLVAVLALAAAGVFSGVLSPKSTTPPHSSTAPFIAPAPITATTPPAPPRAAVAIDHFTITGVAPASVKGGLRIALAGTLVLSGAADGTTVQVLPAWRAGGPETPLHYGSPVSVKAKDGTVALKSTASVQGVSQADSVLVYLVARIGGKEWVSSPSSVALAVVPPPVPQPAPVPIAPRPQPIPPPPTPAAPAPAPPPVAPSIQGVRLSSTSSIRVRAGDPVTFDLAFNLVGQPHAMLRVITALKKADGGWNYQTASSFEALEGLNVVHGLHFASSTGVGPFMTFPVYGLVQLNGKTYESGQPVVVTILPGAPAATTPAGVATPPAPTPAPSGQAKPSNSCLKIVNQRSVVTTVTVVGYNESVSFWDFTPGETGVLVTSGEPLHGASFTIRLYDGKGIDASRQLEGNNKHVSWRFDPSVTDNGKCPSGAWVGTLHE